MSAPSAMSPALPRGRAARERRAAQLSGALGTVALADVLQLLELGRKTGVLAVDGGDGRRGLVRLAGGAIAAARYENGAAPANGAAVTEPTRAVGALLALAAGRFAFTPDERPPAPGPRVRVEAVLMAALHAADERARAAAAPSPAAAPPAAGPAPTWVPVLAADAAAPGAADLPLRARHWAVLAAVDGRRDAGGVAAASGLPEAWAAATLAELCAAGLVVRAPLAAAVPTPAARSSGP